MARNDARISVLTMIETIGLAGGGERLARDIVLSLDRDRFRRTLCSTRSNSHWSDQRGVARAIAEIEAEGVEVLELGRTGRFDLRSWRPLLERLRSDVDVVHAHMFGSNIWASILGTLARTPVVVAHEHTWSFEGQPMRKLLDRELIARFSDAFIAVSSEDRRRMIEIERIDPDDVIFIPNGIRKPQSSRGDHLRQELAIADGQSVIGTVGSLRPQKRYDLLIDAAAALKADFPQARFLIVGDGDERGSLGRRIAELGLDGYVTLLGRRDDVPELLDVFTLAVNSSDFEGSPLSIMEYMATGLPVVATRVGGNPDLIEDGRGGYLVDPGSPEQLARAISQVISEPGRALEMGEENRRRREREFDIATTARRVEDLYVELLGRSGRVGLPGSGESLAS